MSRRGRCETAVPYPFKYPRCWSLTFNRPGTSKPGGATEVGPHVWRIRDHLKRAEDVLAGLETGSTWPEVRNECHDGEPYDNEIEDVFAMRLPMESPQFNEIESLVAAIRYIRPIDFSNVRYWGIRQDELQIIHPETPYNVVPYGCVHVWGFQTDVDTRLARLGITPRSTALPGTAALATVPLRKIESPDSSDDLPGGVIVPGQVVKIVHLPESSRPADWHEWVVDWVHLDDLRSAVSSLGFAFVYLRWIEPVELKTVVPSESHVSVIDSRHFVFGGPLPPLPAPPFSDLFHQGPPWEDSILIQQTGVFPITSEADPVTAPLQLPSHDLRRIRSADIKRVFSGSSFKEWHETSSDPLHPFAHHEHFWFWMNYGEEFERFFTSSFGAGGGVREGQSPARQCSRFVPATWIDRGQLICLPIRLIDSATLRYGRADTKEVTAHQWNMNVPSVRPAPKDPIVRILDDTVITGALLGNGPPGSPESLWLWECRTVNRIGFWFGS